MPFPDAVKLEVKQRAHFQCCICRKHGVSIEVHHIIPEADGGADDTDNAAPLCPSCHEEYGANPVKRTAIRQQRDFWYEHCEKPFVLDAELSQRVMALLESNTSALTGFLAFMSRILPPVVIQPPTAQAFGEMLSPTVLVVGQDVATIVVQESATVEVKGGGEVDDDEDFQQEPRAEIEILEALDKLFDQIWYNRHWGHRIDIEEGRDTVDPQIWKQALAAAARVEAKYKDDPEALGPWSDFEWGMLNGKMSALRWVLGDEWDFLDT